MKRYYVGMYGGRARVIARTSRRLGVDDLNRTVDIIEVNGDLFGNGVQLLECFDMQLIINGAPVVVPAEFVAKWRQDKAESVQKEMQYFLCNPALFGIEYSNTDGLGATWARLNERVNEILVPSKELSLGDIQRLYYLYTGESVPILGS